MVVSVAFVRLLLFMVSRNLCCVCVCYSNKNQESVRVTDSLFNMSCKTSLSNHLTA